MSAPQDGPVRKHVKRRRTRKLARWRTEQADKTEKAGAPKAAKKS